jgi:hypothetical protein
MKMCIRCFVIYIFNSWLTNESNFKHKYYFKYQYEYFMLLTSEEENLFEIKIINDVFNNAIYCN